MSQKKPVPTPAESLKALRAQLNGAELARDAAELNVQKIDLKIKRLLAKHPELASGSLAEAAPA